MTISTHDGLTGGVGGQLYQVKSVVRKNWL